MSDRDETDKLLEWSKSEECQYLVNQAQSWSRHEMKMNMLPSPDGRMVIESVELDPDKMDAELELYDKALAINAKHAVNSLPPALPPIIQQIIAPPTPATPEREIFGKLSEVVESFYERQIAEKIWTAPKMLMHYKSSIQLFIKFFGDRLLHTYHKSEAENFRTYIQKIPKGWLSTAAIANLSHEEAFALRRPKLTTNSARAHLIHLKSFFSYAKEEKFVDNNIFDNLKMKKELEREREPFSNDELRALFNEKNFQSFQRNGYPSRYWAPLLAAFTGCRKGEIFFLDVDSVYEISRESIFTVMSEAKQVSMLLKCVPSLDEKTISLMSKDEIIAMLCAIDKDVKSFWVLDINDDGIDEPEQPNAIKKVKNKSSRRQIPIHQRLIELGFLDFLKTRQKDKTDTRLFKEYDIYLEEAGRGFGTAFRNWIKKTADSLSIEERAATELRGEMFPFGRGLQAR